ncbi:cell wall-binding protein [Enterocloster asparagiformis]|jgi:glucan-binding YG repeat protein|uniref:Cell wall-binding protein n=2 Tax=Enterocloster asparagiformis TaxID=333367 RepID=A0A413F9H5_9FIRM|nr:cell wall-binding protein [Enterocloster asparagiformis]RGX25125.1 cell wall-binding protein [Enterocloster asparagiformis]UWO76000.1 cell wall-binding protein [[Clostridium] asparagiforme DSM 15981]
MRKQTKLVAVLSTAALLAIGASMTSFAAQGWAEEDGTWVYYDKNGDKVNEAWKKSGDNWYWLDDNGEMAVDTLVEDDDDTYYVDANGVMVRNQWVAIENEDAGEDDEPDNYWYYFQSNGKAYKRSDSASSDAINAKVINGKKYAFDTDGRMLYGWVKDGERQTDDDAWQDPDAYYFGDENDGAMSIGWRLISITDDNAEGAQPGDEFWDEDQDRWFWFKSSGKKQTSKANKTINGKKYGFDEYGRMVASWYAKDVVATTTAASTSMSTTDQVQGVASYSEAFMYFSDPESGARYTKGWFKVVPGYYLHEAKYNDGDEYWYYADGDGEIYSNVIKTIKGKKYAFDNYGRMISGLVFLEMADNETSSDIAMKYADDAGTYDKAGYQDNGKTGPYDTEDNFDDFVKDHQDEIASGKVRSYYFGGSDDGAMKTGKQNVTIDGDSFSFKFKTGSNLKGAGINGFDDDKLYTAGKQIKADKDDKYKVYKVTTKADSNYCKVEDMTVSEFLKVQDGIDKVEKSYSSTKEETTWKITYTDYATDAPEVVKFYLLNTSGTVVKSKSGAKDADDYKFYVSGKTINEVVLED